MLPCSSSTSALSLVALAVIGCAVWRARYRPRAGWIWLTAGFAALSLGPFIYIAGVNTYVPGPWALLRYVPLVGSARTPTRFAVVAALGVSILFAGALAALGKRFPQHRARMCSGGGCPAFSDCFRHHGRCSRPGFRRSIGRSPKIRVPCEYLQLPFGIRDGTLSAGNFSARYLFCKPSTANA